MRKVPIIKQIAFELEIIFYKYQEISHNNLISVVICAKNEEGNRKLIIEALNKFKKLPNKIEIIFVRETVKIKLSKCLKK